MLTGWPAGRHRLLGACSLREPWKGSGTFLHPVPCMSRRRQHLDTLGLADPDAGKADIKTAFRRLALQLHPDLWVLHPAAVAAPGLAGLGERRPARRNPTPEAQAQYQARPAAAMAVAGTRADAWACTQRIVQATEALLGQARLALQRPVGPRACSPLSASPARRAQRGT